MSSKSKKKKSNAKAAQKKTDFLPVIAAVAAIACAAVVFLVNGNNASNGDSGTDLAVNGTDTVASGGSQAENSETSLGTGGAVTIASGGLLVIPTADITSDVSFFPLEVDGTAMEVIAVRASDGTIRTAFNTCQSCYTSGRGYYKQEGSNLVCQNCGFHFTPDEVEIASGGCNPWPIFEEDKTVTDDAISISYDFLAESQNIFANWKVN